MELTKAGRSSENVELTVAQHSFTLVLSADYQQSKLIPHWGRTEQPGSTYYLQKVSHDIFGLVDHRNDSKAITICNETVGPKNIDHTISFLSQYMDKITSEFPWIKRICIFLDNAGNTNKNRFLFAWGMEVVGNRKVDHIRFCFLVAGHTKFAPDRLFSLVANQYNREDVFTAEELRLICQKFSTSHIEDGSEILEWRSTLIKKYSELAGVRKFHDFLVTRSTNDKVVMKVRQSCFQGNATDSPLHVIDSSVIAIPAISYSQRVCPLPTEKMVHLTQMYRKYVTPKRWPSFIESAFPQRTPLQPLQVTSLPSQNSRPNSYTNQEGSNPPNAKKPKRCSTRGCDGSGHRNKKRWKDGHNTKAGCPRTRR